MRRRLYLWALRSVRRGLYVPVTVLAKCGIVSEGLVRSVVAIDAPLRKALLSGAGCRGRRP